MESRKPRELKNSRVRRMLFLVNKSDDFKSADVESNKYLNTSKSKKRELCDQVLLPGTIEKCTTHSYNEEESSSAQVLPRYKLRDLPKKKYDDGDGESRDGDFSPDGTEYMPSPDRTISSSTCGSISSLSVNSQHLTCLENAHVSMSSPSTISNLSLYLPSTNFIASPSVIYKVPADSSSVQMGQLDIITDKIPTCKPNDSSTNDVTLVESNIASIHTSCKKSTIDLDETLKPDQNIETESFNKTDVTLTGNILMDCPEGDDKIETEHNFTVEVQFSEARCTDDEESVTSNQDKPAKSNKEKKLTRKRKLDKNEWRCKKNKKLKNSGEAYEGCNSKKRYPKKSLGPTCACKKGCGEKFSSPERQRIFDNFYSLVDRELQWLYLSKHVKTDTIKRMSLERKNNRTQTLKYHFSLNDEDVLVCKKFFLNTLQIGEQMVYTALEKVKSDEGFKDNRGVHNNRPRKMSTATELSIKTHIELFPKVESHYTRKTSKREYLSENLNISKMYRFYTEWFANQNYNDVKMATKRQYETVFNTNYNYSFFKPKKDQCPSCSLFEQADPLVKASLEENHRYHLERKDLIRKIKKGEIDTADKNSCTVAIFDLQKVLNIPQSEVSIFHYKRKYPVYNFTVFDALRKKGYCYVWHFQIAKRGSTEIGSALLHFFKTNHKNGITTFSLYSDGCYGQNKNRYIFALYLYAAKLLGISITHRFFETGHSQNEGDSMHACIERNLKNKVVYTPDQIYNIILNSKVTGEKYCVKELEQSDIYDIKQLVEPNNWRRDKDGEIIHWADVMEVKATHLQENKLFFRYNFEDAYSELDTNLQSTLNIRRRGRKRTQVTPIVPGDIELQQAYHQPIPITKALHTDLMSLCKSGAIPRFYHSFYESLSFTENMDATDKNEEDNC